MFHKPSIVAFLALGFSSSVMAQSGQELFVPIQSCIDQNAATVEPIFDDLEAATRFLAGSVCAEVIEVRNGILLNQKLAAAQAIRDENCKDIDQDSREYVMQCMSYDFMGQAVSYSIEPIIPADARASAAKKLLELRSARLADDHSGDN